jgi:hypothetical protein
MMRIGLRYSLRSLISHDRILIAETCGCLKPLIMILQVAFGILHLFPSDDVRL